MGGNSPFSGFLKFFFSLGENDLLASCELVLRRDITDGAVQPALIIMLYISLHHLAGIGKIPLCAYNSETTDPDNLVSRAKEKTDV